MLYVVLKFNIKQATAVAPQRTALLATAWDLKKQVMYKYKSNKIPMAGDPTIAMMHYLWGSVAKHGTRGQEKVLNMNTIEYRID